MSVAVACTHGAIPDFGGLYAHLCADGNRKTDGEPQRRRAGTIAARGEALLVKRCGVRSEGVAITSLNWNAGAHTARRNLAATGRAMHQSIRQLSSGLRVQSASDDAANMAVSVSSRARIASSEMAARNAQDAIGLLQTTEGALQGVQDVVIRMRELAVQAASDTLNASARQAVNTEYQKGFEQLDRIFQTAEFNGILLLNDAGDTYDPTALKFQIGPDTGANDAIKLDLNFATIRTAIDNNTALGINNLSTRQNASTRIEFLDKMSDLIQGQRVTVGSTINRLEFAHDNLVHATENEQSSLSIRVDTDIAKAAAEFTKNRVLMQAGISMLSQANAVPQMVLRLLN